MGAIEAKRVRKLLDYDQDEGVFRWKVNRGGCVVGEVAGSVNRDNGYISVCIDRVHYLAHRLAFLYVTGKFPEFEVDHIDGNRTNNSFANLRKATRKENSYNHGIRCDNSSGIRGVSFRPDKGKWRAFIQHERRHIHIGYFQTQVEAVEARLAAAKAIFGSFASEVCR